MSVAQQISIAGPVRWDYLYVDAPRHRLYISHGTQTEVVDTVSNKVVGTIADTHGVHGIAIAAELGLGFTSNGADNQVSVFDLTTLKVSALIPTGKNPDAIIYEPTTQRVITFNGRSNDATIINARTGKVIKASIPVGGKPEFAQVDGHGHVYFNIEDTNEVGVLDAAHGVLIKRYSIAPCEAPTGLAIDDRNRLYSACGNGLMVISEPTTGKLIGQSPIGKGADGVALLGEYAVSANGKDGTLSVVKEVSPSHFETVATMTTATGARTVAADPVQHALYLPTADFKPQSDADTSKRPEGIPGTFKVLVVGHSAAQ